VVARVADADELRDALERAPGTVGDPVATIAQTQLAVVTPEGLSIDGAMPFEVRTLVDGFDTPLFHLDGRSALTWWGSTLAVEHAPGVQWGNGVAQLATVTQAPKPWFAAPLTLTTVDAQLAVNFADRRGVARIWWPLEEAPGPNLTRVHTVPALDGQYSYTLASTHHLLVRLNGYGMLDSQHYDSDPVAHPDQHVSLFRTAFRLTLEELYARGPWTGTFAQSVLSTTDIVERGDSQRHDEGRTGFGARNEVRRALRDVAGLAKLDVAVGAEAQVTAHDLDLAYALDPHENVPATGVVAPDDTSQVYKGTIWTSDVGAWTSARTQLAPNIRAMTGLRADLFGTDFALQPRGSLDLDLDARHVASLSAGAYRRAPTYADELEHSDLHPERTSRVAFALERRPDPLDRGTFGVVGVYYLDRTNLVEDDGTGKLANTGRGTTYGASASAGYYAHHWFALANLVVEHSDRQVTPTTRARPFEYDQPVRLDLRVARFLGPWQLAAHWSLRAGLPYTQVAGAHYDADRDVYLPDFATLYAERFPWQHQLDVRVDRAIGGRVRAYLDIANVYDARTAIGWDYNFNFTERRAVTTPAFAPTLGIRGEL